MVGMLEVLKDVANRFESEDIEYFLVGSMAAMYYGRPTVDEIYISKWATKLGLLKEWEKING